MAEVLITAGLVNNSYIIVPNTGVVWASLIDGYVVFVELTSRLRLYKTEDGGENWSLLSTLTPSASSMRVYALWFDKWTPGNTGTVLHITFCSDTTPGTTRDGIWYIGWDTSDDTYAQSEIRLTATNPLCNRASIVRAKGGRLSIAQTWNRPTAGGDTVAYFYTSDDEGATWQARTTFQESTGNAPADVYLLMPGNEADEDDLWAPYFDVSTDELSLYVYDDDGDSWSETSIDSSGFTITGNEVGRMLQASIRHSDGHMIIVISTKQLDAAADIRVYDVNGAGSITAKTDCGVNISKTGIALTIDQNTDYIYVMYCDATGGTAAIDIYYVKSIDGGGSWSAPVKLNTTSDSWYSISADWSVGSYGGRLMPVFFQALDDDAFVNFDNAFDLAFAPPSTLQGLFCRGDEIQVVFSVGNAYRSPDFGTTWYPISGMVGQDIRDVGFDHLNPQNSFFGGNGSLWVLDHVDSETYYFAAGLAINGIVTHIDCDLDSGVSVIGTDQSLYKTPDFGLSVYEWKALAVTDVGIGGSDTITTS